MGTVSQAREKEASTVVAESCLVLATKAKPSRHQDQLHSVGVAVQPGQGKGENCFHFRQQVTEYLRYDL